MNGFVKVWFERGDESTVGLVFTSDYVERSSVTVLSRSWPMSEVPKMRRMFFSPIYDTWEGAFYHDKEK